MFKGAIFVSMSGMIIASAVTAAIAGGQDDDTKRHRHHRGAPEYINVIPGTGTYSGSLTVYRVKGTGTSTTAHIVSSLRLPERQIEMKIIEVNAEGVSPSCSIEAGVCVIRP